MDKRKFEQMRRALDEKGYEVLKSIGKGAFGEVVVTRKKQNSLLYAVKSISKSIVQRKPFLQKYIDQEIEIMKKLSHGSIVKQEATFDNAEFIFIVLEYCELGNLLTYQSKLPGKVFPMKQALRVIVEVMKGLRCIHEKNFIHRDIKSENILLKKAENGQLIFKIADFGFARAIGGNGAKTHCGTEKYMAPQIIANTYYGVSVDIWALAVLFYFMLFAEYPFKSHDMRTQITRRCTPSFNLALVLTKKERLKDLPPQVEDFFKKIFVVDAKQRAGFSEMVKHPLFKEFQKEFQESADFYGKLEKREEFVRDNPDVQDYNMVAECEPEDESRAKLLKKKTVSLGSKHLEREIEEIGFQIQRVIYLRECAHELFDNYSSYLSYSQRLAAKFYLLKAELFYLRPLLKDLSIGMFPSVLKEAQIDMRKWAECVSCPEYKKLLDQLHEQEMRSKVIFEDTYHEIEGVIDSIGIKFFKNGFKPQITEKTFQDLKVGYRSTTSHLFKVIHCNKQMNSYTQNKIKMRLFCCHMINRIFTRKEISSYFPYFTKWLMSKSIKYPHAFDFIYFKKWIYEETQENLEKNISHLHKIFFS